MKRWKCLGIWQWIRTTMTTRRTCWCRCQRWTIMKTMHSWWFCCRSKENTFSTSILRRRCSSSGDCISMFFISWWWQVVSRFWSFKNSVILHRNRDLFIGDRWLVDSHWSFCNCYEYKNWNRERKARKVEMVRKEHNVKQGKVQLAAVRKCKRFGEWCRASWNDLKQEVMKIFNKWVRKEVRAKIRDKYRKSLTICSKAKVQLKHRQSDRDTQKKC